MSEIARLPKANIDAECCVLGSILLDSTAFDEVADLIKPDDFYKDVNKTLYCTLAAMVDKGEEINAITVHEKLQELGELGDVGGLSYLVKLAKNTATPKNAKAYAGVVRNTAIERRMLAASSQIQEIVYGPGGTNEKLEKAQSLLTDITGQRSDGPKLVKDLLSEFVDELDYRFHQTGDIIGLPTGFEKIDELTSGLGEGDLVILAGRPGMGKSTLAQNIAENVCLAGKKALFFSLEMSGKQVVSRLCSSIGRVPFNQIRSGKLEDENWVKITSSVSRLTETKFFIDDQAAMTVTEMGARARRVKREHGLDLVIVDYLQLMGGEGENETLRITAISRGLKLLAKDLGVPVIALSQLNRSLEQRQNKRPILADLRQSGSIEQDADTVMFIYRDEVYNENSQSKGLAQVIIAKQRNGPTGKEGLVFRGELCRFENFAGELPEEHQQEVERVYSKGFHG